MRNKIEIQIIARAYSDLSAKFGIPRQSGLAKHLTAKIVFEPGYRNEHAVRGLEEFSHIWLIWQFSENAGKDWSPTVRPPRLGGNTRKGVFATRSPFRPNGLGMSSVRLEGIEYDRKLGPVLHVSGIDMMDGTPIFDIKPYLPYVDSHPDAKGGFAQAHKDDRLQVQVSEELKKLLPPEKWEAVMEILMLDPRPSYQNDPDRVYGVSFAEWDIRFKVADGILIVQDIVRTD